MRAPNPFFRHQVEAVYRALAAETVDKDENRDQRRRSHPSGKRGTSEASAPAKDPDNDTDSGAGDQPARQLHATISRYFDEGPATLGRASLEGGCESGPARRDNPNGKDCNDSAGAMSNQASPPPSVPLPHQPLDKRACEVLIRDASVLVSDPSFRGRLDAGFDDFGGGGGGGGGLGFFDVVQGGTASAGGGNGGGLAPHAWLLKVRGTDGDRESFFLPMHTMVDSVCGCSFQPAVALHLPVVTLPSLVITFCLLLATLR